MYYPSLSFHNCVIPVVGIPTVSSHSMVLICHICCLLSIWDSVFATPWPCCYDICWLCDTSQQKWPLYSSMHQHLNKDLNCCLQTLPSYPFSTFLRRLLVEPASQTFSYKTQMQRFQEERFCLRVGGTFWTCLRMHVFFHLPQLSRQHLSPAYLVFGTCSVCMGWITCPKKR